MIPSFRSIEGRFTPVLTSEDAKLIESWKFSRTEIASTYRMPVHLIGGADKAPTSSLLAPCRPRTRSR